MKRDMDLIRALLLKLEAWPMGLGSAMSFTADDPAIAIDGYDVAQIYHHLKLIHDIGLFDDGDGSGPMLGFVFCGL